MPFLKAFAVIVLFSLTLSCHNDKDRAVLYTDLIEDYKEYDEILNLNIERFITDIERFTIDDPEENALYKEKTLGVIDATKTFRDSVQQINDDSRIKGKALQEFINRILDGYKSRLKAIHNMADCPFNHETINRLMDQAPIGRQADYGAYIVAQIQDEPKRRSLLLTRLSYELHIMEHNIIKQYSTSFGPQSRFGWSSHISTIHLSKSEVHNGEELSIFVTIDYYGSKSNPELIVNNKRVHGQNGIIKYTFKAQGRPGKYWLPLVVQYMAPFEYKISDTTAVLYNIIP